MPTPAINSAVNISPQAREAVLIRSPGHSDGSNVLSTVIVRSKGCSTYLGFTKDGPFYSNSHLYVPEISALRHMEYEYNNKKNTAILTQCKALSFPRMAVYRADRVWHRRGRKNVVPAKNHSAKT